MFLISAISFRESQKGASSIILVRWPLIVTECFIFLSIIIAVYRNRCDSGMDVFHNKIEKYTVRYVDAESNNHRRQQGEGIGVAQRSTAS